ncbi:MAG: hypothetical protein IJ862_03680 [Selenomonadaceae bacterium]|nr:hypothetical protein [Selenomonadaceae bacterium]
MAAVKLEDKRDTQRDDYILAPISEQAAYIEKFDAEDTGLTFSPTTDTSKAKAVAITDAYASTIFSAVSYTPLVTLDASGRNDPIRLVGNDKKNNIIGGKGADTLSGGDGADSLTGGEGADTFISSAGKNVITDYSATQGDVIMLNGVTPTKVSVSKNKVVITNSDKSAFTINNGKEQELKVVDLNGNIINEVSQAFGATELTATTGTTVMNTTLNTSVKTIIGTNASNGSLVITGNSKANSIVGSNFVDNTLIGGAGKDTLTGGEGWHTVSTGEYSKPSTVYVHNTFVFAEGQGTNVITNYDSASDEDGKAIDAILLSSGSVLGYTTKKNDVIFTIALDGKKKTTLTVKDGKNRRITFLKPDGSVDTGNTMIYRNATDYIVTDQATVSTSLTDVTNKLGDKVKLIDASTSEFSTLMADPATGAMVSRFITGVGVYIEGNKIANSIVGSRFRDTITGGAGKDTMSGGHSSLDAATPYYDTFLYYSGTGNDVITDYIGTTDPTLSDVIKLANPDTTISTSALNTKKGATDVVFTVTNAKGKNKTTLTLKGAQDSLVTIVKTTDTLGGEETIASQKYGNKSLSVGTDVYPIEYAYGDTTIGVVDTTFNAKVVTLDGGSASGNLYLIGNSGKNVIMGSKTGSNSLQGGAGKDTLYGTAGVVDTFIYDTVDGTDAIVSIEAGTDIIKMASTDVHITASTLVTKKGANDVQLTIGKSKVVIKGIADTVDSGVKKKGKAVINYLPPKLTIDRGDGTKYRMTYAGTLAKIEDDDVEENGILDFKPNALVATIDAGAIVSDTSKIDTIDGSEVTVAVSSTLRRNLNLGIIGNANANTIIGATNNRTYSTDTSNMPVVTTITGGKGNDAFMLAPGGDILITDYNTNAKKEADSIVLLSNQALKSSSSVAGSTEDLLLVIETTKDDDTTMDNHITVKGGLGKNITIVDADGKSNTQTFGLPIITIDDKSSTYILADGGVQAVVDGGRKKAISITSTSSRSTVEGDGISIQAGSGNDTLNGGPSTGGISTLTGGSGKDIFMHSNSTFMEVITDYTPGKDKLEFIEGLNIASIKAIGDGDVASDIVMHFTYSKKIDGTHTATGDGDITIQGGFGQKISIVKEREEEYYDKKTKTNKTKIVKDESTQVFGASEIEVLDVDGATVDASDGANNDYLKVVDASQRSAKKPIVILGNAVNNTGKSDKELEYINNNTLIGGKGDDTIYSSKQSGYMTSTDVTGNAGADTFIYRGGNVTIEDYTWNKKSAKSDVIIISSDTALSHIPTASNLLPDTINVAANGSGSIRFNGEDVTFIFSTVSSGSVMLINDSLTLKNAKDKMVTIIDSSGATISHDTIYANPYEWTVANKTEPTTLKAVYIDSSDTAYNAISASSRTKAATIQAGYEGGKSETKYIVTGGKKADYLIGNEVVGTLVGGKGNDTLRSRGGGSDRSLSKAEANYLTGGDGKDVFYFNPTTSTEYDIITDYQVGKDVLRLPEGYYVADATVTSAQYENDSIRNTTLTGVQASLSASGVWEVAKNKKKTIAKNVTTTANDVILTIANSKGTVGTVTIWDAGGYSSIVSASEDATIVGVSTAASLPAIGAYKISIATESTNAKGKTVVNTSALDLVSTEVVVVNADGTTIDVSANPNVVNILPSSVKPKRTKAMYVVGNGKSNNITGTAKADTLSGNGALDGIDTLTGAGGANVFLLDGKGDVLITDYTSAKGNYDKIRLGDNVTLNNGEASGSDLVFTYTYSSGTGVADTVEHHATVKSAAATKITLVGSDGKAGAQVYGSEKIEVANADGTKVDVGSNKNVKSIDASKRTKAVWLVGNESTSTLLGGKKADTLEASKLVISDSIPGAYIDSGAGNDIVYGSNGADTVILGAGADTFISGGGNDTVTSGAGKDVIIYNGGNMVITDHDQKNDRLELQASVNAAVSGGATINYALSLLDYSVDSDMTVTLNLGYVTKTGIGVVSNNVTPENTIKILNGVDKTLKLTNAEGKTETLTLSDPETLKVTNNDGANIAPSNDDTIKTINASKRTTPVNLTGNNYTTYIKGGTKADTITLVATKGGTIQGGKGDDTLSGSATVSPDTGLASGGNAGKMFYAYTTGDGKDVITNYAAGDVIVLGSAKTKVNETKSKVSGSDYVLAIGSGSITFKNCADVEIQVQDYGATTTTTYNKKTATVATYTERLVDDLFVDDVLVDGSDLTDIISHKPSTAGELSLQSEELQQDIKLVQFTDKKQGDI